MIFTTNASGALKLVGESYPFSGDNAFVLAVDSHNSVGDPHSLERPPSKLNLPSGQWDKGIRICERITLRLYPLNAHRGL